MQQHSRWRRQLARNVWLLVWRRPQIGRRAGPLLALLALLGLGACREQADRTRPGPELRDVSATVRRFPRDSESFVLVPDDTMRVLYLADDLPAPFRSDGLQVVFSGRLRRQTGLQADYVRPITLLAIRRRDPTLPGPI